MIGSTPFLHAIKGNQNRPNLKHFQGSVTFFKYVCNSYKHTKSWNSQEAHDMAKEGHYKNGKLDCMY